MRYLPHTREDIDQMLRVVGAEDIDSLFTSIPRECRRNDPLDLPGPFTEWEVDHHMHELSIRMADSREWSVFLGAGSYDHYIPASIQYLLNRSEFSTAYTPYQPEKCQGTLQAIFEYQTLMSGLLGLEVSNASMYDGASSLAEALFMALRLAGKKSTIALSRAVNPFYRQVVRTYFKLTDFRIVELPVLEDGRTDYSSLEDLGDDLAAVAVQSPNFFGCIEDLESAGRQIHQAGGFFITCFSEALAYGLLKSPGEFGADIVCGEGQSLGIPQSFGGPGLGIFCTRKDYVRRMPGRLVGESRDKNGQRGFVLTLATREQHIRREKATSNICSNQGLCATTAAMYLASVGGTGLKELARLNRDKAQYLKKVLGEAGCGLPFSSPTFNEFVVRFPSSFDPAKLHRKKCLPGLELGKYYPELEGCHLLCVTETKSKEDLDGLAMEVAS